MQPPLLDRLKIFKRFLGKQGTNLANRIPGMNEIARWEKAGRPAPPPHRVKIETVRAYGRRFSATTFIETGTYNGDMVSAVKNDFQAIYSIELDDALFRAARDKFSGLGHIHILHGDSAVILPEIFEHVHGRCVFWLDAHYSGGITARSHVDTPVVDELRQIISCNHIEPVILIDDARLFMDHSLDSLLDDSWPHLTDLRRLILDGHPLWTFEVEDDIIRVH